MQRLTGVLVGAVFGFVFVLLNTGAPLAARAGVAARCGAGLALAVVAVAWVRAARSARTSDGGSARGPMFGRGYLVVVGVEVVALFGGLAVLRTAGAPEECGVAWVAVVVGAHFLVLARVWREASVLVPGAALTVLGVLGLVLAGTAERAWTPVVSGALSGAVLLAGALWTVASARTPR
ncbi:hypothetical protein [Actinomadura flavalba]|uniref:hypothetical protein n=1 Tax=Actinomadura flavalba TaxID=1120938 RepID=UPI000475EB53|nr:hypothetical protein [Actinomadura flavalba]